MSSLKDLKKSFQPFALQLTITWRIDVNDVNDYLNVSKYIDYMHTIEPVDYSGSQEKTIRDLHISNMEKRINALTSMGVPSSKLVMDVYFSVFQFPRFSSTPIFKEWPFNQFCGLASNDNTSNWDRNYNSGASLVTLHNKNVSSVILEIIFQSTRSMANRAQLAMKSNLAGVAAIFINYDDFQGNCGLDEDTFDDFKPTTKFTMNILNRKFPLLRTINEAITATLEEIGQEPKPINNGSSSFGSQILNFICNIFSFLC